MHGGNTGFCNGGPPEVDHDCFSGPPGPWWPYEGTEAGDCCCHTCSNNESCFFSDATPGAGSVDIPPTPW
jgi:hypothetical protein